MRTVVSDSTPLIYLAGIGKFYVLETLYGRVCIPAAVYDEVVTQGAGRWGAAETASAGWIDRHTIADPAKLANLQSRLHRGESEVVVLADELHADLVIMDESAGRRELVMRGIAVIGTVGVLMQAKLQGLIVDLKPELDQLRLSAFHLSDHVYRSCLALAGE